MFSYFKSIFVMMILIAIPVSAQTTSLVQAPCRAPTHNQDQACVIVVKTFQADRPMIETTLDLSVAKSLMHQTRAFSVIYVYRAKKWSQYDSTGIMVSFRKDTTMTDLTTSKPVIFWVSTKDGGKTWSSLKSSED